MQNVESPENIVAQGGDNSSLAVIQDEHEEGFGAIFKNGIYQPPAHFALEKRRFETDCTIEAIVDDLGDDVCNFIQVRSKKSGTVTELTYHPNPEAILPESLSWITCPAIYVKNGGRFYREAANGKIEWNYKVLRGTIFDLIERDFEDDFMAGNYKNSESAKFYKKVANFIINHPHESARKYGVYLKYFKDMIAALDDKMTDTDMEELMISITSEMKRVAEYKDRELEAKQLYFKVLDISTKMTVQACSKAVHYRLNKIDKEAENAKTDLVQLSMRADKQREAERVEKQARIDEMKAKMNAMKNKSLTAAPKRKLDEITDGENAADQPPAKQQRIEEVVDQTSDDA